MKPVFTITARYLRDQGRVDMLQQWVSSLSIQETQTYASEPRCPQGLTRIVGIDQAILGTDQTVEYSYSTNQGHIPRIKESWKNPEKLPEDFFDCSRRRWLVQSSRLRMAGFLHAASKMEALFLSTAIRGESAERMIFDDVDRRAGDEDA